jgi:hypothetical protein
MNVGLGGCYRDFFNCYNAALAAASPPSQSPVWCSTSTTGQFPPTQQCATSNGPSASSKIPLFFIAGVYNGQQAVRIGQGGGTKTNYHNDLSPIFTKDLSFHCGLFSTCSCEDPKEQLRECSCVGVPGKCDAIPGANRPCTLEKMCPGIAESASATISVGLSGAGLWTWVKDNMDGFIAAFKADIVNILHLSNPEKVTDIVATEGRAALLSSSSSNILADDEIQHVDVTFTLQP